ncbi:MAG: PAS domain-containing hybrid sensor histidine kinase/response regulator [Desulfomonilaceae bacterium]
MIPQHVAGKRRASVVVVLLSVFLAALCWGDAASSSINEPTPFDAAQAAYLKLLWTIIGLLALGVVSLAGVVMYRRRYEAALRESEERYRDLFDHSADIIYTHDLEGNYTSVNEAGLRLLGLTREEFIGMNFRDLVDPEFLPATEEFFQKKIRGEVDQTGPYELAVHAKDGRKLWFEVKTRTMFRDGKAVGVHGTARDITERKRLQEELREVQERYRAIVEEAQDLIVETDARGVFTFVNPATVEMTGYSQEELIGKSYLDLVAPEFREAAKELYETQGRERYPFTYIEMPYVCKDGRWIWLGARTHLIVEGDKVKGVRCIARDITERKRAEEALQQREAKYKELYRMVRLMCDNSPDMIWAKDLEGRFIFANRAICEKLLAAKDTDEPVGKTDMFFAERERREHPENPGWHTFGEICVDSDAVIREERVPRRFDEFGNVKGKFLFLDVFKAPMWDEQGRMIGVVGSARDVTEEKRRDEERARLITAINQTADTIIITDPKGVIQFVNPAFEKTTGYTKEEAIGKTPSILKSGKQGPEFYKKLWATLRAKKVWTGRFINRKKDGTFYEEDATITPVKDASGRVISYVAVKRDVTKESMLQKELLHAQKMEALGVLAGGIAHDLNNILQVILGYCQLLKPRLTDEASLKGLLAIAAAGKRAGDLVARVLTFSRKIEAEARPLDMNQEIRRAHELLLRTIPKMIDIRLDLADNLDLIHGDPLQIEQVLMNLSVNAAHAMPDGGVLTIQTQNVTLDTDFCAQHVDALPGDYVLVTIADTGCGMEEDVLARIFEPFFTTKKIGEGTGLGLSIVYGVMAAHKGFVRCQSQPGAGTTFSLYFPKLQAAMEDAEVQGPLGNLSGAETILLVDDEDEVVSLASEAFAGYGYTLYTARTGEEALRLYQEQGDKIDLVVLDLVMPGMGGRQCLKELRTMDPNVRVLVASGFATDETVKQLLKGGAMGFLKKPFEFEELLAQIRAILDGAAPRP